MTVYLNRTDLTIATVISPLVSYGLHRMAPAPDWRFIAVASTLNIYVGIALRAFDRYLTSVKEQAQEQAEKTHVRVNNLNTEFVVQRLSAILQTSTFYLLPIFAQYIAQRAGIKALDNIPLIGYTGIANGAFWMAKYCVEILQTYKQA